MSASWNSGKKSLTQHSAAKEETSVVLKVDGTNLLQTPVGTQAPNLIQTWVTAEAGMNYELQISNPKTHLAANVKVDGEHAIMKNKVRRPDGSVICKKPARVPVWKGKAFVLKGYQTGKERTTEEFSTDYQRFQFQQVQFQFNPIDFPAIDAVELAGEDDDVLAHQLQGGIIEVFIHELLQCQVPDRSKEGGEFKEGRTPKIAPTAIAGARTVPGNENPKTTKIGSRMNDTKEDRGRLILRYKIFYGLNKAKDLGALLEADADNEKRRAIELERQKATQQNKASATTPIATSRRWRKKIT